MASKTNIRKSSKSSAFLSKHWWKIGILILFLASTSFIGYNKYLDQQNVNNMKQLLADFEQLKIEAEKETGEAFYILTTCESIGKFADSYKCGVYLNSADKIFDNYRSLNGYEDLKNKELHGCFVVKSEDATEYNSLSCTVAVRANNANISEEIFYDYDTSPGRPF